ncbi:unnamed protein product [Miscanthus lutarioriparius]|uniref:Uncharacterized protein n=1 Tax=Miscanthus lutarioriparius TaxID=422564 RepID=A0A811Q0N3_9POAL|nr:unnamed protein product [Miscanthus lutarioriparius]
MTEPRDPPPPTGCAMFGIYSGMFRRRRSASMTSLHRINGASSPAASDAEAAEPEPAPANPAHHRKPGVHHDSSLVRRPNAMPVLAAQNGAVARAAAPAANDRSRPVTKVANGAGGGPRPAVEPAAEYTGMAAELDKMILDHQRVKGTTQLVRATSGNMMLHRNLGNLNAGGGAPRAQLRGERRQGGERAEGAQREPRPAAGGGELCRALSHRTDPEKLKEMGNEEYRQGHYAEAVALYDQAIMMDTRRPAYWSNKAAALAALGRLIEAVGDCKEAVRIDPSYDRAHHRLGCLYLRLGEPDKAIYHLKQSSNESAGADVARAQSVKSRIAKSSDARRLKNWITVLQEAQAAVSDGADCAPQVMALQAEALLRLQRHDDADSLLSSAAAPRFGVDESTKFFGTFGHAYFLIVRAQVDMAAGRFEDAVATAQTAFQLDPSNREVTVVQRRAKAAAAARLRGNDLFKAAKFVEACAAYGEGLDREPGNAVLLCNRAACHAKLGRHEKAVEDCSDALVVRPSYSKARLRRADCNVKLERWEASLRDYQVLIQELPENEDVKKALSEVEAKLKGQRNGGAAARSQH